MNVRNLKNNRTVLTALRGLILLVILATMLSLAIQLVVNRTDEAGAGPAIAAGADGTTAQETERQTPDLFVLAARQNPGAFRPLAVTMYAAMALMFLLTGSVAAGSRTLILGLYGLVVVALVTSVIVNLYNETRNTEGPEDGKDAGKNNETAV